MNASLMLALMKWHAYQRWMAAVTIIPACVVALIAPEVAPLVILPPLLISAMMPSDFAEFTFPLTPRALMVARLVAVMLLRLVPVTACLAIAVARVDGEGWFHIQGASVLLMAAALSMLPELLQYFVPRLGVGYRALVVISAPIVLLQFAIFTPVAVIDVFARVAASVAGIGVARLLLVPPALPQASSGVFGTPAAEHGNAHSRSHVTDRAITSRADIGSGLGWRDLLRLLGGPMGLRSLGALLPAVFLLSFPISQLLLALSILGGITTTPVSNLSWLALFPVSRRVQLAIVSAIPVAITLLFGSLQLLPFRMTQSLRQGAPETSIPGDRFFDSPTRVPITYWMRLPQHARAQDGRTLASRVELTAPWGERAQAFTITVGRWTFFNPYSTRLESSSRWVEWQHDRMTRAVFGRPLSRVALRKQVPPRRIITQSWSMLLMQGSLFLSWMLLLVWLAVRTSGGETWKKWRWSWIMFLPTMAMLYELHRGVDRGALFLPLIQWMLLRLQEALPSVLLVIPLSAAPVAMMLWLIDRGLKRREPGLDLQSALAMQARLRT